MLGDAAERREIYDTAFAALAGAGLPMSDVTYFDDVAPEVFSWACKLPGITALSGTRLSTRRRS